MSRLSLFFIRAFERFIFIFSFFLLRLLLSFFFMADLPGILPSAAEYRRLEATNGSSSLEGVEFPAPASSISSPPPGKIGVFLKTLDDGIRFPLTEL